MNLREKILVFSIRHPRTIMAAVIVLVLGLGSQIPRIVIDTDPENMLPADQASRVFHNQVKRDFTLYDIIVVGVVNEKDQAGDRQVLAPPRDTSSCTWDAPSTSWGDRVPAGVTIARARWWRPSPGRRSRAPTLVATPASLRARPVASICARFR